MTSLKWSKSRVAELQGTYEESENVAEDIVIDANHIRVGIINKLLESEDTLADTKKLNVVRGFLKDVTTDQLTLARAETDSAMASDNAAALALLDELSESGAYDKIQSMKMGKGSDTAKEGSVPTLDRSKLNGHKPVDGETFVGIENPTYPEFIDRVESEIDEEKKEES